MTNVSKVVVCFDLGGVLAFIRRTWQECIEAAQVCSSLPPDGRTELPDFSLFDEFQLGTLEPKKYLHDLADYLSVSTSDALKVHNAILERPYPGTHKLVRDLEEAGVRRACLSNTNVLHWELLDSQLFGAIKELDIKVVSHEINLLKPDPKVFGLFDQKAGTSPAEVIFFDDHQGNVSAARLHGWNAYFIDFEGHPDRQMRATLTELGILASG